MSLSIYWMYIESKLKLFVWFLLQEAQITDTLCHHRGRVNGVKWAQSSQNFDVGKTEIVSVSSDKTAVVWTKEDNGIFAPSAVLTGMS